MLELNKPIKFELVTAAHVHGKSGLDIDGSLFELTIIIKSKILMLLISSLKLA